LCVYFSYHVHETEYLQRSTRYDFSYGERVRILTVWNDPEAELNLAAGL